jgi:hypothetical protein
MTEEEHTQVLNSVAPTARRIYEVLSEHGPMTAPMLREPIGRADGMTKELGQLLAAGLIRPAGRAAAKPGTGAKAKRYETVPLREVEETRERYAIKRPRGKKPRRYGARITELRQLEHGSYPDWYRTRTRVLQLAQGLAQMEPMTFWRAAPDDDLDVVFDELVELSEEIDKVIAGIRMRRSDDAVRSKISKLRDNVSGRTSAEAATARRLASKLEARLDG